MSVDLCLVNGYGVCLNDLSFKSKEKVDLFIKEASKEKETHYIDYLDYISDCLDADLEIAYIEATSKDYLYIPAVLPLKKNEKYLFTKEEIAEKIYSIIHPLIKESKEEVLKLVDYVFDWEVC
ncbi:MAG: hypothetical protein IJ085_02070 [Turicibacter sp.]|nr:hypothetical protein [Turicibacter sp.]